MLTMPTDEAYNYLRPLYVTTQFDGQLVFKVLVDNWAAINVLLVPMLKKVGKKKNDIFPTNLIMINLCGTQPNHLEFYQLNLWLSAK